MHDHPLIRALPPELARRLQSLRQTGGRLVLVADASGLPAAEHQALEQDYKARLAQQPGVTEVHVALTAEKPRRRMIAIGSGKGGVGKSTLTTNLAVALARSGRRVGVVDADIYGPSQPMLLGTASAKPESQGERLVPVPSRWGVPVLSMGHLIAPGRAIAWRGPMAGKALAQLFDAQWGDTDLLLVDLPPGTGDVQISMLQKFRPDGAVIVSTPQDLALIDAARAGQLLEQAGVPVIGLVENMAGYICPHCGEESDPFGRGGIEAAARRMDLPFLGRVPLVPAIREASDKGAPPAAQDGAEAAAFAAIATRLGEWLDQV
ncbi:Mrp/NBP35 family ATP-binding protein [Porphyrobacter sp. GA68]|uniref:Mrp/NBP35 family ATP-binding protein n=1 Tax=Porphyrobacter sp. GA68 TaxID=2883480 RepID=UPI001D1935E6|nr:Mrp/NBP35 family ATP-binding protein [Porphyrobacter sp. GA68]